MDPDWRNIFDSVKDEIWEGETTLRHLCPHQLTAGTALYFTGVVKLFLTSLIQPQTHRPLNDCKEPITAILISEVVYFILICEPSLIYTPELGELDPNWFETLTAQATSEENVSDQDDLCPNQEGNFKTPFDKPGAESQLFSTPKVFRRGRVVSPEPGNETSFTAEQGNSWFEFDS